MPHVYVPGLVFCDNSHTLQACSISWPYPGYVFQEADVNCIDDLQVPRQDMLKKSDRPLLQRLRQQGVIRVPQRCLREPPGLLPREIIFVNEHPHQFCDGHGRMSVIELNGDLRRESLKSCMGPQIFFDNIPDGAGDEKVLLDEPEFLASSPRVRGIQYLGDRF